MSLTLHTHPSCASHHADDLLSCMAALQLLHDAAQQCDAAMAASLAHVVMHYLAALLVHPEPVLQGGALKAAASLLGASLQAGAAPMAVDGAVLANGAAGAAAADPLVAALKAVLDVGGVEEVAQEVEEAALDAGEVCVVYLLSDWWVASEWLDACLGPASAALCES